MRSFSALLFSFAACSGPTSSGGSTTGSSQGAPLDCSWLQGNNCYKTAVAAAASCLPVGDGTLSSDGASCSAFDAGGPISFQHPFLYPLPTSVQWEFTVALPDGGLCLAYHDLDGGGFALQTSVGTFSEQAGGFDLSVVCPDGSAYSTENGLALLSCDGGLNVLPGSASSYSPTSGAAGDTPSSISFSLLGTSTGVLPVLVCIAAP